MIGKCTKSIYKDDSHSWKGYTKLQDVLSLPAVAVERCIKISREIDV